MDTAVIDTPDPASFVPHSVAGAGWIGPIPPMPPSIAKAIGAVCRSVRRLQMDGKNIHQGYRFASIDAFLETVGGWCADAGLIVIPEEVEATWTGGTLCCRYRFWLAHEDGALWQHPMERRLEIKAVGPQAYGSAESYVMKRFLRALFKVPTGDAIDPASDVADPDAMPRREAPRDRQPPRREPPRDEAPRREVPTTNTAPVEYRIYNGLGEVVGTHSDLAGWGSAIKAYLSKYPGAFAKNAEEIARIEDLEMSFPGLSATKEAALRKAFDSILAMQPKVGGEPDASGDPVR